MADQKTKGQEQTFDLMPSPDFSERLIIQKFFSDKAYTSFISENFKLGYFENPTIQAALFAGNEYYKKYGKIPPISIVSTILEKMGRIEDSKLFPSYVNEAQASVDDEYARDITKSYIQQRALFDLIFSNSDQIMKTRDVSPYISDLQKIANIDFYTELGFNYFENIEEHIFDLKNPENRTSTGYSELDRIMNGGIPTQGRCMIVFMAQPGLGKSMLMHNIAVNLLMNGKKVLIVSLEMTEQIYARRISANLINANINELQLPANLDKIEQTAKKMKEGLPDVGLIIKEFPPSTLRSVALSNYIERLIILGWKPDVVFVDYLNLMIPNKTAGRESNSYERVGEVGKEIRGLSYKFEIPFITATQTNRNGFNNSEADLSNISESSQTGHTADFIGSLTSEGVEHAMISLTAIKNRFGRFGAKMNFQVDPNSLRMTEMNMRPVDVDGANALSREIEDFDTSGDDDEL